MEVRASCSVRMCGRIACMAFCPGFGGSSSTTYLVMRFVPHWPNKETVSVVPWGSISPVGMDGTVEFGTPT